MRNLTKYLLTLLPVIAFINVYPQTQKIHFNYDPAGNRWQRYVVTVACRISKDSVKVDSVKGNNNLLATNGMLSNMQDSLFSFNNNITKQNLTGDTLSGTKDKTTNGSAELGLTISPNPAAKFLNIEVYGLAKDKRLPFIFFDTRGRIYLKSSLGLSTNIIPMDMFPVGIYFLMIYTGDKPVKEKIVVVK